MTDNYHRPEGSLANLRPALVRHLENTLPRDSKFRFILLRSGFLRGKEAENG